MCRIRANEIAREFYACTDIDKALEMIRQLANETTEWLEKDSIDPKEMSSNLIQAWKAALDALATVEKYLAANPEDPHNVKRQQVVNMIKEILKDPNLPVGNTTIIVPS